MKKSLTRPGSMVLVALIALAALAFSGCESGDDHDLVAGERFTVGELEYKVTFSRLLNIHDSEDADYLPDLDPPPAGSSYLGVWIEIVNEDGEAAVEVPDDIHLVDSDGDDFEPLDTGSIFALEFGQEVPPKGEIPALNTAARMGPVGGALIAFEVPDAATENRPLQLVIPAPDEDAHINVDI